MSRWWQLPRLPIGSRRAFRSIAIETGAALAIILMGSAWIAAGVMTNAAKERDFSRQDAEHFAALSSRITSELEQHYRLLRALARSDEFVTPADLSFDSLRSSDLRVAEAFRISYYDGVYSRLIGPTGPPVTTAITRLQAPAMKVWQLTRGLPLRLDGRILARARRSLAGEAIGITPGVVSIAELDATGTVVYLVPYRLQLTLPSTRIDSVVRGLNAGGVTAIAHPQYLPTLVGPFLSFTVPLTGRSGQLVLTARAPTFEVGETGPFWLFDSLGRLVLWAGGTEPQAAPDTELVTRRITDDSTAFALTFSVPSRQLPASIASRISITLATLISAFLLLNYEFIQIFHALDRVRGVITGAELNVEDRARTLAHDIRNAIFSLRGLSDSLVQTLNSDELQSLNGAITDLEGHAEHLSLRFAKEAVGSLHDGVGPIANTYLRGALENVAKQVALGPSIKTTFHPELTEEVFVAANYVDVTRILSNLLKNAAEACENVAAPAIQVDVIPGQPADAQIVVRVSDNGCGIEPDNQDLIFDQGFTTKRDGKGHGLHSATQRAQSFGGHLRLTSSHVSQGTTIELTLPRGLTPPWFVNTVQLTDTSVLVIVDDEKVAYEYWRKAIAARTQHIRFPLGSGPTLLHLTSPAELKGNKDGALARGTLFMIDQSFGEGKQTGLQLIGELQLQGKSILVTNFFEQDDVIEEAVRIGVGILPKTIILNTRFPIAFGVEQ